MADTGGQRPELVSAMLERAFYPQAPKSVELRETHISWVFLAGDLAYKVKKPLVLPFLDYGTLERRREMCREEVRLNRRLAPQIYLEVVAIARHGGHFSLAREDDPAAIEYAVQMRRVEEGRSLASLIGRGQLETGQLARVARRLAAFHAEAEIAHPQRRPVEALAESLRENLATLGQAREALEGHRLDSARRFTEAFMDARRVDLERRARSGLARDCHGDLRAEHVIVPAEGEIYVYDCVEFNPALRQIDVAADIAFLVMDLARLGHQNHALQLAADYRQAGGDYGDDALLSFFASYRAWVRAKVAWLRGKELPAGDPERRRQQAEARELLRLGHRFAWQARRPLVLVLCGVAGTGKTTLAQALAEISGWPHVSSDVTRKRLSGQAPTERGGPQLYTAEKTKSAYAEMGRIAAGSVRDSGGVIVDATFHLATKRAAFRAGLGESPARLLFVECRAPHDLLLRRIGERAAVRERISDADEAVLDRQLAEFEPLDEVPATERAELVTERPPEELVNEVEAFVDHTLWGGANA